MVFTEAEREYLASQRLARLATVDSDGRPQNNPVRLIVNDATGMIEVWGMGLGETRKFRNAQANPAVAVVVDDVVSTRPWRVRGIEVRGRAETLTGQRPPYPSASPPPPGRAGWKPSTSPAPVSGCA